MKNAIIGILAVLCGFLGWKTYGNSPSQSWQSFVESGCLKNIRAVGNYNIQEMLKNFHNHTMTKTKNPSIFTSKPERTDGKVTQFVRFDTSDLRIAIQESKVSYVSFIFASFDKEAAEIYVDEWNKDPQHSDPKDKITLQEVIQKPTVLLGITDDNKTTSVSNRGKICPPPSGSCP